MIANKAPKILLLLVTKVGPSGSVMTIYELTKKYFKKIDRLDLELIIEDTIKKPRSFILAHPEYSINNYQSTIINKKLNRKLKGEPMAYILGYKEFYGLKFKVNKNVLVPRPETEMMVDEARKLISDDSKPITIIDVGTGSGCIIITLAKELQIKYKTQDTRYKFIGTDISGKALTIAKQNSKLNDVNKKIKFIQGDLLNPVLKKSKILNLKSKIIILANLPYLTPTQIKKSPSIKHEPKLALTAGSDGLKYYRELLKQISQLSTVNCQLSTVLEIDPAQVKKIKVIIKKTLPKAKIKIKKDLCGLNRFVYITI